MLLLGSLVAEVVGPASTGMAAEVMTEPMFGVETPVGIVADKEGSLLFVITASTVPSTTLSTTRAAAAAAVSAVFSDMPSEATGIPDAWAFVAAVEDASPVVASEVSVGNGPGVVVVAIVVRFGYRFWKRNVDQSKPPEGVDLERKRNAPHE